MPPKKKTFKKLECKVNCTDIYNGKNAREIHQIFRLKNNIITMKVTKFEEVGFFEQIRLDEYLREMGDIRSETVYSKLTDCHKITFDNNTLNVLYEKYKKTCLSIEDLSLMVGYMHFNEQKAFYDICLLDFTELPRKLQEEYKDGEEYEFIAIENSKVYPECEYSISFT